MRLSQSKPVGIAAAAINGPWWPPLARRLGLEKGAHGVAGILAWPGRYSRHLHRVLPIDTEGRADGGTDYYIDPDTAAIFTAARKQPDGPTRKRRPGSAR